MTAAIDIPVARVMTGPPVRQIGQMVITAVEEQGLASSGAVERHEGPAKAMSTAGEGPPINIFASHLVAFLFGVLFVVVSYVGTAYWSSLRASEEASEFDRSRRPHPRVESAAEGSAYRWRTTPVVLRPMRFGRGR